MFPLFFLLGVSLFFCAMFGVWIQVTGPAFIALFIIALVVNDKPFGE